tara:strand:- start:414 stop:1166 length:753 start_codon:yes stop_codon:yes gene_type:complete
MAKTSLKKTYRKRNLKSKPFKTNKIRRGGVLLPFAFNKKKTIQSNVESQLKDPEQQVAFPDEQLIKARKELGTCFTERDEFQNKFIDSTLRVGIGRYKVSIYIDDHVHDFKYKKDDDNGLGIYENYGEIYMGPVLALVQYIIFKQKYSIPKSPFFKHEFRLIAAQLTVLHLNNKEIFTKNIGNLLKIKQIEDVIKKFIRDIIIDNGGVEDAREVEEKIDGLRKDSAATADMEAAFIDVFWQSVQRYMRSM